VNDDDQDQPPGLSVRQALAALLAYLFVLLLFGWLRW